MAREVDILSYLPPILREIKELQKIAEIENVSLEQVWSRVEAAFKNQFVMDADENGIARYERILKLTAGGTETLETRRFRVLARFQEQAPYTNRVVKKLLDNLLGEGKYTYERNTAEKWLRVRLELIVARQFEVVELLLERVTPQNMVLTVELRYNQHSLLAQYTHTQLATFTHQQLREEVIS